MHDKDKLISTQCPISLAEYNVSQSLLRTKNNYFYDKSSLINTIRINPCDPVVRDHLVLKEVNSDCMPSCFSAWHYAIQTGMNELFKDAMPRVDDFLGLLLFSLHCKNFTALDLLLPLYSSSNKCHTQAIQRAVYICVEKNWHISLAKLIPYYSRHINQRSTKGKTILDIAIGKKSSESVAILLANGAKFTDQNQKLNFLRTKPLLAACKANDCKTLDALLRSGHYNLPDCLESARVDLLNTANVAAIRGNQSCLELLLQYGLDVDEKITPCGSTALFLTAANGHIACVELLLAKKADVNYRNSKHETRLFAACCMGNPRSVQLLIENGASINTQCFQDWTPLIEAIISPNEGSLECVKILLKAGADVSIYDAYGNSPYKLAVDSGKACKEKWKEVLSMLEKPRLSQNDGMAKNRFL